MKLETFEGLLTLPERLHTSTRSVRRLVQKRQLVAIRIPGVRGNRFSPSALEALIDKALESAVAA